MFRIFLTICMTASVFGGPAVAGEFRDYSKDTKLGNPEIHMCRGGSFMVGVHVGDNVFLCDDSYGHMGQSYPPSELTKIGFMNRYQSHGMAACPPGKAMVGLHVARNELLCAPLQTYDLIVDINTVRPGQNMHACPKGSVMVGIHVGKNLLLCGRVRQASQTLEQSIGKVTTGIPDTIFIVLHEK